MQLDSFESETIFHSVHIFPQKKVEEFPSESWFKQRMNRRQMLPIYESLVFTTILLLKQTYKCSDITGFNELLCPFMRCGLHHAARLCYENQRERWMNVGQLSDGWTGKHKLGSSNCEQVTLELIMVLWRPLSLTLMVICLSERSGLMNGGWILMWGFFLGSNMYLQENRQQV